jgi:DNA-binding response OmpR family regulator
MRILLVEDDDAIAVPLSTGLQREGFEVEWASTGAAALAATAADLVLLDLGLPDLDGRAVCRQMRDRDATPIIVVSASGEELDRVTLLELGADDYVVKPFGFRELVARIRAVLRRSLVVRDPAETSPRGPVSIGHLTIDHRVRTVSFHGQPVELTPKEFDLLMFLSEDPGAVYSRDEIMTNVWDAHWWGSTKTLDVHIASLRRKLDPGFVETVRGVGFRLALPPTAFR